MKQILALAVLFATSQAVAAENSNPLVQGSFVVSGSRWCQPSHTDRFTQWATNVTIDSQKQKIRLYDSGGIGIGDTSDAELDHEVYAKGARGERFQVTGIHSVLIEGNPAFAEFGLDENGQVSNFTLMYADPTKTCTTQEIYTRVSKIAF